MLITTLINQLQEIAATHPSAQIMIAGLDQEEEEELCDGFEIQGIDRSFLDFPETEKCKNHPVKLILGDQIMG